MKLAMLLAVIGYTMAARCALPPHSDIVAVVRPGAFANTHCDTVDLATAARFLVIAARAFANATGFAAVVIPANTQLVNDHAFANSSVVSVTFLDPATIVGPLAFLDLKQVAVACPSYRISVDIAGSRWHETLQGLAKCEQLTPPARGAPGAGQVRSDPSDKDDRMAASSLFEDAGWWQDDAIGSDNDGGAIVV